MIDHCVQVHTIVGVGHSGGFPVRSSYDRSSLRDSPNFTLLLAVSLSSDLSLFPGHLTYLHLVLRKTVTSDLCLSKLFVAAGAFQALGKFKAVKMDCCSCFPTLLNLCHLGGQLVLWIELFFY